MIRFTWYELLWLFFIYSFLGWVLETAAATVKQKKFANRGLVNGPFCVIYGIAALFMTFGLQELRGVWLFLFATIYATVIEWVAGHLIEKAFKVRWWDYSKIKWNLDGYICKPTVYRKTPLGREISDVLLAVNRSYHKSDYIPCICWGRNARFADKFEVGSHIQIWGRIQSREYQKKIAEDQYEKRVAYEVSVSKLEYIAEEN